MFGVCIMRQYILKYKIILQLFQYAQKATHLPPRPAPHRSTRTTQALHRLSTRTHQEIGFSLWDSSSTLIPHFGWQLWPCPYHQLKQEVTYLARSTPSSSGPYLNCIFLVGACSSSLYDTSVFTNMVLKSLFIWCQFLIKQLYHCGTSCLRLDSQPHFCFVLFGLSFPCELEFAASLQKVWRTIPVLRNSIEQPSKGSLNLWVGWRLKEKCSLP